MTVKEFIKYLNFYKDEMKVNFRLPSGQEWVVDDKKMLAHNLNDREERKDCKIFLK